MTVDYSLYSVLQVRCAEIDEKTELKTAETQLRQKLLRMHRKQCLDGFEFDNDFSVHDEVRSERLIKSNVIVQYRHRLLTLRS